MPSHTTIPQGATPKVEMLPGVWRQTLTYGEKVMLVLFTLDAGATIPLHTHAHEQAGYLVKGEMEVTLGGDTLILRAGESYTVPGGVEHGARAREDTVVVDAFTPLRDDYLPAIAL